MYTVDKTLSTDSMPPNATNDDAPSAVTSSSATTMPPAKAPPTEAAASKAFNRAEVEAPEPKPIMIPSSSTFPPADTRKRKLGSQITLQDCQQCIIQAYTEKRITHQKALRLRECLESTCPFEIIHKLLNEQIPQKRFKTREGYKCRLCAKPLKGHVCPYCPVCSTADKLHPKDGKHTCFNCPQCFEAGRKKKRLVQIKIGEGTCPHGQEKRDEGAAMLLGFSKSS